MRKKLVLTLVLCAGGFACTDLNVPVYDKIATFWRTDAEIEAGVAAAYVGLRSYWGFASVYTFNETSSDEIIVPLRGTDWGDTGLWEQLWKHTWTPNLSVIEEVWQSIYANGIDRINQILESLEALPKDAEKTKIRSIQIAELKTMRALYYYMAIDLFGNIPIITSYSNPPASQLTTQPRKKVFEFIEKELKENLWTLPKEKSPQTYGRATYWLGQSVLAKLYLNAEVFTGSERWADCMAACDSIITSGGYILEPDFFANFKVNNENSGENIFVIPFDINNNLNWFGIQGFTLHYNSYATFGLNYGGYNGWCSAQVHYGKFDPADARRKMFLVGQQYENQHQYVYEVPDPAIPQDDGLGHPLIFDPDIPSFHVVGSKTQVAGARCAKWEFNVNTQGGSMSNDLAMFRLADIILMKAEAQFRSGDGPGALTTINQTVGAASIRSRTGLPDFSMAEMTLDGLLDERARELSWEGHRRTDMIRFGKYLDARIPDKAPSESFRTLFPIPQFELNKNPYLKQNPGYVQ